MRTREHDEDKTISATAKDTGPAGERAGRAGFLRRPDDSAAGILPARRSLRLPQRRTQLQAPAAADPTPTGAPSPAGADPSETLPSAPSHPPADPPAPAPRTAIGAHPTTIKSPHNLATTKESKAQGRIALCHCRRHLLESLSVRHRAISEVLRLTFVDLS